MIKSGEKLQIPIKPEKIKYNDEIVKWQCGYFKKNTLAGYAHINFLGNLELLKALVNVR